MRIGPYETIDELGRGGMGIVYRATDTRLRRPVALKMMTTAPEDASPDFLERFAREARAAGRLRHPGIVPIHNVGVDDRGRPYMVMELITGRSLGALRRESPPSARRVAEIVRDIAEALQHAHEHGVLHRDLKPENILIEDDGGRPRVTDFGLAHDILASRNLTATGQIIGTPSFMAPEQAASEQSHGVSTDVYGLGGLLYFGLVGDPPFVGHIPFEIIKKVLFDEAAFTPEMEAALPASLRDLTLRCLEKQPRSRPASAHEVAVTLTHFLSGRATSVAPKPRDGPARPAAPPSRIPALIAGIAIGAVAATTTLSLIGGDEATAPPRPPRETRRFAGTDAQAEPEPEPEAEPEAETPAPEDQPTHSPRARALELAFAAGERARNGDTSAVIVLCELAIEIDPDCVPAYLNRAGAHLDRGEHEAALDDIERVVTLEPENGLGWEMRGLAFSRSGRPREGLASLDRAVELLPDRTFLLHSRAELRRRSGDRPGALRDVERALVIEPDHAATIEIRGLVRLDEGELPLAIADFERASELQPHPNRSRLLGLARWRSGDLRGALAAYDRSVELDPRQRLTRAERGRLRKGLGDIDGAIADITVLLELAASPSATDHIERALLLITKTDHAGARRDLERALALEPSTDTGDSWFVRANLLLESGDFEAAIPAFERTIELWPHSANRSACYVFVAIAAENTGDLERARLSLQRFLLTAPRHPRAPFAKAMLRRLEER